MNAAIVELDSLPDTIRPGAQDQSFRTRTCRLHRGMSPYLGFGCIIGLVVIGGCARKFRSAGIDGLECRDNPERLAAGAHDDFARMRKVRYLRVRKAIPFRNPEILGIHCIDASAAKRLLHSNDIGHPVEEKPIDSRKLVDVGGRPTAPECTSHIYDTVAGRTRKQLRVSFFGFGSAHMPVHAKPGSAVFQGPQRFAQGFFEGPPNGHHLADSLHARRKRIVGIPKLLEREPRRLHHAVVDARLETRRGRLRDIVHDFRQGVAHREPGSNLCNGKSRRFRGEGRRARHARVHLDDHHAPITGIHGKLHVRATGFDAHLLQDSQRCGTHTLVFHIGKRLRGSDRNGIARVHTHRVEVFNRAHDDAVSRGIAHDFHFEFLPTLDALFHQHLARGRQLDALRHNAYQLIPAAGYAAARSAKRKRGAQHHRIPNFVHDVQRIFNRIRITRARRLNAEFSHAFVEKLAVFTAADRRQIAADHLNAMSLKHSGLGQFDRHVQRRLPAEGRQERIRLFLRDDFLHERRRNGLDIRTVGKAGIGHDSSRIAVYQHDSVSLFAQHLACLRTRIIELARLANHNGPRPNYQDGLYIVSSRHA